MSSKRFRALTPDQAVGKSRRRNLRRLAMQFVSQKIKREDLFQGILDTLREWPNLDRQIFAKAHYHGQSIETISRSLNLDVEEVRLILEHCNRELYAALRIFRESCCEESLLTLIQPASPATCSLVFGGCSL
jgi:DNA-directed RNA polymerase specialized sigma24 family protein